MIRYTAQCRECSEGFGHNGAPDNGVILYDNERERDDEAKRHMDRTGHTLAVGYVDTDEAPPYTCPRCETFHDGSTSLDEFKKNHNERVCMYGFH